MESNTDTPAGLPNEGDVQELSQIVNDRLLGVYPDEVEFNDSQARMARKARAYRI